MKFLFSLTLYLFILNSLNGQGNIFLSTSSGALYKVNPATCAPTLIGNGPIFTDVAFLPNGKLYGTTGGAIYEIDTNTAISTLVVNGLNGNSLVGASNGMLYSVSNSMLQEIDIIASTITNLGNVNCLSSGDLAFISGDLYLTCSNNGLLKIDINNPGASFSVGSIIITGSPYGIVNVIDSCAENPYIISSNGNLYTLNHTTAAVSLICNLPLSGTVYGAASLNEFKGGGGSNILGNDLLICPSQTITLDAYTIGATYKWNDNSTDSVLHVSQAGTYWVEVYRTCDTLRDTIVIIDSITNINLGNDTTICNGQSVLLNVALPGTTYLWQDNSTSSTYTVTVQGLYWVEVQTSCDTVRDSIYITIIPSIIGPNLGNDTTLCAGSPFLLDANTQHATHFVWNDNSTDSTLWVTTPGTYWVNVSNSCESFIDSISISYQDCEPIIIMPNVFSPNGDGQNDRFVPIDFKLLEGPVLSIYNRWGNLLYQTMDLDRGWDGTHDGKLCSEGTYYWILTYNVKEEEKALTGFLSLFN